MLVGTNREKRERAGWLALDPLHGIPLETVDDDGQVPASEQTLTIFGFPLLNTQFKIFKWLLYFFGIVY